MRFESESGDGDGSGATLSMKGVKHQLVKSLFAGDTDMAESCRKKQWMTFAMPYNVCRVSITRCEVGLWGGGGRGKRHCAAL